MTDRMTWREQPPEEAGRHARSDRPGSEASGADAPGAQEGAAESEQKPEDLLTEVNAVAQHLRELQRRLGGYRRRDPAQAGEEANQPEEVPRPAEGLGRQTEEASEHVAAIIAAAEAAAAEIRARAEASAAEIIANAESGAARIREEARSEERRLFEAIDALRPAASDFQHALERVHDAAVAALMSYPRD